tara:strand:- start:9 stop:155 length:147 start_codon:yes stop_codon:yes gene_type:complete
MRVILLIFFLLIGCTIKTSQKIVVIEEENQKQKVTFSGKNSSGVIINN